VDPKNVIEHSSTPVTQVLGDIVSLLLHSPIHRKWPFVWIERYLLPPLHHGQYRLFHRNGKPIGYVSWAWFSQEVEDRFLGGGYHLTLADWKSGDLPWIIELVAPYGDIKLIRQTLRDQKIFPRPVKAIRPEKNGKGRIVMQFGFAEARRRHPWRTRKINVPRQPPSA